MNWNLFITFCVLNVLNVIIQTVKSICTIKCIKYIAALVNALAYGLYTVVIIYMVCELELWLKVIVVALANLIGVFVVKLLEEKSAKDKLWKVEATVRAERAELLESLLKTDGVMYNLVPVVGSDKTVQYVAFNIYCHTKEESRIVRDALGQKAISAKFFVEESKTL